MACLSGKAGASKLTFRVAERSPVLVGRAIDIADPSLLLAKRLLFETLAEISKLVARYCLLDHTIARDGKVVLGRLKISGCLW